MRKNKRKSHFQDFKLKRKELLVLLISLVLLAGAVGVSYAWLNRNTGSVTNYFSVGDIQVEVMENFPDHSVKENVKAKNNGTSAAWIRMAYTVYWADGKDIYPATKGTDYIEDLSSDANWLQQSNGSFTYYYWSQPVNSGDESGILINSIKPVDSKKPTSDCYLKVDVMVQAVQAFPEDAVKELWPGSPLETRGLVAAYE